MTNSRELFMYRIQICLLISLYLPCHSSWATDWFKNTDQQAQTAFEQKDYAKSAQLFADPYQRGVALYRNGQYAEAIKAFTAVTNPETKLDAQYNLGNAYFQQSDYQKAIAAYEQVLAERPTDTDAKHNLVLAKQLLKSQQQDSSTNQSEKDKEQDSSTNESEKDKEQNSSTNESGKDKERNSSTNQSERNTEQQQDKQSAQSPSQKTELPKSQANAQDGQQPVDKTKSQDKQLKDNNPSKIAEQPPTEEKTTSTGTLPNEEEVMAEVLLNRLEENPQRLLRNQFYLDAQRTEAPPPTQPW